MNTSVISDINVNGKGYREFDETEYALYASCIGKNGITNDNKFGFKRSTRRTPMELYSCRFTGKIEAQ